MFVDTTNQIFLTRLHEEYEKVCQDCLEQVDSIKVSVSIHSSFYFFFQAIFPIKFKFKLYKGYRAI